MQSSNIIEVKVAKTDRDFVGIKVKGNKASVTFPIGYEIKEENINKKEKQKILELYSDVKILMATIEKCSEDFYDAGNMKFSFSSAIFLIEDFMKNGLYSEQSYKTKTNGNGRIEWKRTIQNKIPLYSSGNYLYYDTYNSNISKEENKITQIQKYCLSISLGILGWLYNIGKTYNDYTICFEKEEMIYTLKEELNKVNEDRKKKLLEQMILFIDGVEINLNQSEEFMIGTYYFDKIWETILRNQAYHLYEPKNVFPTTYYCIQKEKILNSKLLPDITIQKDDKIIIMDAKYYRISALPESSDICKQLFYGQYIKNENKNKKIINMFLLPNNMIKQHQQNSYWLLGYAGADLKNLTESDKILTYYLDTKSILKSNYVVKQILENI